MVLSSKQIEQAAAVLGGASNAKRLEILSLLSEREISVGALANLVDLSQSALSQHLAKLRRLDLVSCRRDAQTIYYASNSIVVGTILEAVKKILALKANDTPIKEKPQLRVLIVEDDYYLAEEVKITFERAGAVVIGPASDETEAFSLLNQQKPNIAIVDLNLGKGVQFSVVEQLRRSGVPFCVVTGYDRSELRQVPPDLGDIPWMIKPARHEALLKMAISACGAR